MYCLFLCWSCSSPYPNQLPLKKTFPTVTGNSLSGKAWAMPKDFSGPQTLLILGYKQDSQFDIDRWLIGLDMKGAKVPTYEIPTIKGLFPRMFATKIDEGMRRGIPKELWKGVITVYKDGDTLQRFTGNTNPNNARVILLDNEGIIQFFYDGGFSVTALNQLIENLK